MIPAHRRLLALLPPPTVPAVRDGKVLINATLNFAADSNEAENVVVALRRTSRRSTTAHWWAA